MTKQITAILLGQHEPKRIWSVDQVLEEDLAEAALAVSTPGSPLPPLCTFIADRKAALVGFQPGDTLLWHGMIFFDQQAGFPMWQTMLTFHPELPDLAPPGVWFAMLPTPSFDALLPSEQRKAIFAARTFAFALAAQHAFAR